jgi:hypothetical protein
MVADGMTASGNLARYRGMCVHAIADQEKRRDGTVSGQ